MHLQPLQQLLKQKMDRKQFLRTVGLILMIVVGLSFLVKQPRPGSVARRAAPVNNDIYGG